MRKRKESGDKIMKYKEAAEKASKMSKERPITVFVYVIDLEDDVDYRVTADESYFYTPLFKVLNGEVLAEYYDGTEC